MNNLDKEYQMLLEYILGNGVEKKDRTGTGTKSIFGWQIRHNMSEGFPLLTTKKMAWKTMVTELLWFLRGDTNIKYLVDNNCHIWDGDAYKNYFHKTPSIATGLTQEEFINKIKTDDEFAKKWGDLGKIYGFQWRKWGERKHDSISNEYFIGIDQIANLISELKTNPDSRRLMVNAWNVGELDQMVLPPCHYGFQVYTRELSDTERLDWYKERNKNNSNTGPLPKRAISLMWNQRSVDTFLGLPFNIASYGLLLEIIAKEVNMIPDELIGNLGDVHLYNNHIEQAEEQIGRELTLEERRAMVTQEQFNKVYTAGSPDTLSHSEIDQFGVPRRTREPYTLPRLCINTLRSDTNMILGDIAKWSYEDFTLENYQSHPTIKAPLSN